MSTPARSSTSLASLVLELRGVASLEDVMEALGVDDCPTCAGPIVAVARSFWRCDACEIGSDSIRFLELVASRGALEPPEPSALAPLIRRVLDHARRWTGAP